jgi:mycothiol synthase
MNTVGSLRAARAEDAEAILDLAVLSDLAEVGEPHTTIDEINVDLANDQLVAAVVEDGFGDLLGYSWVEMIPGHANVFGDIILRPGSHESVIKVLFDWLRRTSAELGPGLPAHVFANPNNTVKCGMYEEAGGTIVRRFYRMAIVLDQPPVLPELTDGIEIRQVERTESDLRTMHELIDTAFLDHFDPIREPYERWLALSADGSCQDLSLWWFATVNGVPGAGLYGSELPESGYVDVLGTLREYRGRGLAKALLLNAFGEFYRRGRTKVGLSVDADSLTGATRLYQSVGMTVQHEWVRYALP